VIVGQAGTGKSTARAGVARAHQAAGREIVVTSTGAQAAERLAAELGQGRARGGVLDRGAAGGARERCRGLGPGTTVIHDEAALASTREPARLLTAAAQAGARLIG